MDVHRDGWIEDQTRNRVAWLAEGRGGIAVRQGERKRRRRRRRREEEEDGVKANVPLGSERCSNCENRRGTEGGGGRTSAEAAQKVNVQGANLFEVHGPRSTSKLSCRKPSCPIC